MNTTTVQKILVSSRNPHKRHEIQAILENRFQVIGPEDIGFNEEVEESGATLEENARIKALALADWGGPVLADDSGLEIEALGGAPGVHSARFAGSKATDLQNIQKVLKMMEGKRNRRAQFSTVLAYFDGKNLTTFNGSVAGTILFQPRGNDGFGYDPIFVADGHTKSFSELSLAEKNSLSHRKKALDAWLNFLDLYPYI